MDLNKKIIISDPFLAHPKENPEQLVKWPIVPNAGSQELDESWHDNNILGYNILNEGFYWKTIDSISKERN